MQKRELVDNGWTWLAIGGPSDSGMQMKSVELVLSIVGWSHREMMARVLS